MMAWTERAIDTIESLAGDAFRRVGSLRLAVDEEERDELRTEYEALVAAGFAAEWIERFEPPLEGRFTRRPASCPGRRAAARPLGAPPRRCSRPRQGSRFASTRASRPWTRSAARRSSSVPTATRVASWASIEGLIIPTRGQVIATEPVPERYFEVPHYGRHGFDYWHQAEDGRIVAGGFRDVSFDSEFTADERAHRSGSDRAARTSSTTCMGRELRVDYAWAGIFGMVMDFLPVVGRVPGLDDVWVAAGYRATATCSGSPAVSSSPGGHGRR